MQPTSNILLSIIIPVYGVEDYIDELMDSLFPQLTSEVECLFIDDGCLDNSISLIKNRLKTTSDKLNIKIISQNNQGVSAARNTGLEAAVGQYITFLDPDDYVLENYINLILSIIKSHSVDIIHFNALKNDCFNNISQLRLVEKEQLIQNNEEFLQKLLKKNYWYPWLRVIHKNSLNDFSFPVGYILEDMLAIPHLYKKANSIYEISENLVFYRYRKGSLINNNNLMKLRISNEKGISDFRQFREDQYLQGLYIKFIEYSLKDHLNQKYNNYCNFVKKYTDDLSYIRTIKEINNIHWKSKLMINYPKTFYFYKAYTRLFKKKL